MSQTSTERTTDVHQEESKSPRASGKSDAILEAGALDRPARDPFAMAPSELSSFLEAQVESGCGYTKGDGRDHCIDQRYGKEQPALGG